MGCIYVDFDGNCQMYERGHPASPEGADEEGACVCDQDPNPADTCTTYESDWVCPVCGADLNVEECEC